MSGYEAATTSATSQAGPSRDLELAKKAYKDGDLTASIAAHEAKSKGTTGTEEEHAGESSEYIKYELGLWDITPLLIRPPDVLALLARAAPPRLL